MTGEIQNKTRQQNANKEKNNRERKKIIKNKMERITIFLTKVVVLALLLTLTQELTFDIRYESGDCSAHNVRTSYAVRLKKSTPGEIISFKLKAGYGAMDSEADYIETETPGVYKYGQYEIGDTCYMHKDRDTTDSNPFFLIVSDNSDNDPGKCKISRIITNKNIEPCGAATTTNLWSAIKLLNPTSVNVFQKIYAIQEYRDERFGAHIYRFAPTFTLSDVTNQLVEMMLAEPYITTLNSYNRASMFNYDSWRAIDNNLGLNSFASSVNAEKYINRITYDDFPGYYLGVYSGGADETEKFYQTIHYLNDTTSRTLQGEFFIEKPDQILGGEIHAIQITSQGFFVSSSETDRSTKQYD